MFLYSGMADVAYETGDPQLVAALDRLHDSVTLRRMYVTGGIGPSSKNEGFTDDYDLPNENAYQETCASAGMVLWNFRMFKLTGDGRYVDLVEQSLYNAVLAGVSLEGNTFCYATPLACDPAFKRQPWFEVPCCPTTAARFFPSIGRYAYSESDGGIWVNLFVGGLATISLPGRIKVTVKQTTNYPWEGRVKLQIVPEDSRDFTLHVRIPSWASGSMITLNGKKIEPPLSKGYAQISRKWKANDAVELNFPMSIEELEANPQVLPSRGKIALKRGPLIYCLEQSDNGVDLDRIALPPAANLNAHFEPALLGGVTVISGQGRAVKPDDWSGKLYRPRHGPDGGEVVTIKAIPYCVWGNRGQQKMKVWMDSFE